jgi:hypothetical protein
MDNASQIAAYGCKFSWRAIGQSRMWPVMVVIMPPQRQLANLELHLIEGAMKKHQQEKDRVENAPCSTEASCRRRHSSTSLLRLLGYYRAFQGPV